MSIKYEVSNDPVYHGLHVIKYDDGIRFYAWVTIDQVWEILRCDHTFAAGTTALKQHLKSGGTLDNTICWKR